METKKNSTPSPLQEHDADLLYLDFLLHHCEHARFETIDRCIFEGPLSENEEKQSGKSFFEKVQALFRKLAHKLVRLVPSPFPEEEVEAETDTSNGRHFCCGFKTPAADGTQSGLAFVPILGESVPDVPDDHFLVMADLPLEDCANEAPRREALHHPMEKKLHAPHLPQKHSRTRSVYNALPRYFNRRELGYEMLKRDLKTTPARQLRKFIDCGLVRKITFDLYQKTIQ